MYIPVGTKFIPPKFHHHIVPRQRLIDELNRAVQYTPVTLIAAPAGSGKTTLLAGFTRFSSSLPAAWFSLDVEDNDSERFIRGLIRAIQTVRPNLDLLEQVQGYATVEPHQALALLINEILASDAQPFLLIFDDLHWISEQSIFALLNYLLDHLPPQMYILLSGRYEPPIGLARLRVRRQLAELKFDQLAFTQAETKTFLRQMFSLNPIETYTDAIYAHTKGWAAGISLLATLMADEVSVGVQQHNVLNMLGQSNRLIFDFLADEILNLQRPELRQFLLESSILSEMTPETCAQLTGRENAFILLDEIYRRNLFLMLFSDSSGKSVYRYHDLFAAFLRERLSMEGPLRMRHLHRRAAEIALTVEGQMTHWLAAKEWHTAAQLITREGERLVQQGVIGFVHQSIITLPDDVRIQHPFLIYLLGVCAAERWELDTATMLLRQAANLLEGHPALQGAALLHLANVLSTSGSIPEAILASEQALNHPITLPQRAHLLVARAWQAVALRDEHAVNMYLDSVLALIEQSGNDQTIRAIVSQYHVQFTFYNGGIERTWHFCRLAERLARYPIDPLKAASLVQQGWLHLWRGDWDLALAAVKAAKILNEQLGTLVWLEVNIRVLQCICLALSDQGEDQNAFQDLFEQLQQPEMIRFSREWLPLFQFIAARIAWTKGQQTGQLSQTMSAAHSGWPGLEHLSRWLQALAQIDAGDNRAPEQTLQEAVMLQRENPSLRLVGDARTWLAYFYLERGDSQAAESFLSSFLDENHSLPGRIRYEGARVSVPLLRLAIRHNLQTDLARRTLAMLLTSQAESRNYIVPETGEILTQREAEVLQLIAQGATNPEIADALTISIHTVKIHVAHLLAKLNVSSRTTAALRARDIGLTPPQ